MARHWGWLSYPLWEGHSEVPSELFIQRALIVKVVKQAHKWILPLISLSYLITPKHTQVEYQKDPFAEHSFNNTTQKAWRKAE